MFTKADIEKAQRGITADGAPEKGLKKNLLITTPAISAAYAGIGAGLAHHINTDAEAQKLFRGQKIKKGKAALVAAGLGLGLGAASSVGEYRTHKSMQTGLKKYPKSYGELGEPGYTESYPENSPGKTISAYFKKPKVQLSAREVLDLIMFGKMEDEDTALHKGGRILRSAAVGGLAGRIASWHPVTGGRMNRGTAIGAAAGAVVQGAAEHIAAAKKGIRGNPINTTDESRAATRDTGKAVVGAGLFAAAVKAQKRASEDSAKDMASAFMGGRVSEEEATRRNAKHRRAQGFEGETFIPKMPKFGNGSVPGTQKAGPGVKSVDEIGGNVEDKLERLARRAKGTPEGDAAARKLHAHRAKAGKTVGSKIKKKIGSVVDYVKSAAAKVKPKAGGARSATKAVAHLLSARERLNEIIELKAYDLGETYPSYGCGPSDCNVAAKKSYPTLYVSGRETDIDLPLSGEAKIKYRLRSKTIRQDEDGKKRHSADIEIQSIEPVEGKKKLEGSATPIKMSARQRLDSIIKLGNDPRPRNRLGMFDDSDGGPNQKAIHATYRPGVSAGEALAGGAIAGVGSTASGAAIKALMAKLGKKKA